MPKSAEQANKALVLEAFETNVLGTLLSLKHELRLCSRILRPTPDQRAIHVKWRESNG
jgi:hypothetical protein